MIKKIKAKYRKKLGSNNSNKIRKKNYIPAIIYKKKKNINIKINYYKIWNLIKDKKKIKNIKFKIKIKKLKFICNIKEIQKHPYKNKILHIDFM